MRSLVILPTYNEIATLPTLLAAILAHDPPWDILIIDDNSPDGTGALADTWHRRDPRRIIVRHRPHRQGLASAVLAGFQYAQTHHYDRIVHMDADGSHHPDVLPRLARALDTADVVVGSRYVPGGQTPDWPWRRRLLSRWGSWYAHLWLNMPIADVTSGFKGFRLAALQRLDFRMIRATGFAFQIEVVYQAWQRHLTIEEIPITFTDRQAGRSKLSWSTIAEALIIVPALRWTPPIASPTPTDRMTQPPPR
jgi:dolichol-phosphate mannosyltransferase